MKENLAGSSTFCFGKIPDVSWKLFLSTETTIIQTRLQQPWRVASYFLKVTKYVQFLLLPETNDWNNNNPDHISAYMKDCVIFSKSNQICALSSFFLKRSTETTINQNISSAFLLSFSPEIVEFLFYIKLTQLW